MKINVNWSELQRANDGNTTHYGGFVKLKWWDPTTHTLIERKFQCSGNDRQDACRDVLYAAVEEILGQPLSSDQEDTLMWSDIMCDHANGTWDSEVRPNPDISLPCRERV